MILRFKVKMMRSFQWHKISLSVAISVPHLLSTLTKARLGMAVNGLKVYLELLEDIFDGDESKEALETTNTPLRNKIVTWTPRRRT